MISCSFKSPALLVLLCLPIVASAQLSETTASEDERIEALIREQGEFYAPKTEFAVGFRMLASGTNTHFGNLGIVPLNVTVAPASDGAVNRTYNNGSVSIDVARAGEVDANGIQTSVPGSRYKSYTAVATPEYDDNGVLIGSVTTTVQNGDLLSYTPGLTRQWEYVNENQTTAKPGYIAMSSYSATSDGGFMDHEMGPTAGVELTLAHRFGKGRPRIQFSVVAGIAVNNINNRASGSVAATLNTNTDYYSLNGQAAPALPVVSTTDATTGVVTTSIGFYSGPTFTDLYDSAGTLLATNGYETSTPITDVPSISTQTSTVGGAIINGTWQVKGAYFMMRVGPSIRARLTDRLGLSASVGFAAAYAGTRFTAVESFENPDVAEVTISTPTLTESLMNKVVSGYYADMNVDWSANEVLAIYGGISTQKLGSYDQELGGRLAKIDLGNSLGYRGGVSIRF